MAVNYLGVANGIEAVLPAMLERGQGHIAMVASVAGYRGLGPTTAYGPTKAAVINLAEALRNDLAARGIKVSVINPGYVETPMTSTNKFPMPFIVSAEDAARRIIRGLEKGKFEIAFPWQLVALMKLGRLMPNRAVLLVRPHHPGPAAQEAVTALGQRLSRRTGGWTRNSLIRVAARPPWRSVLSVTSRPCESGIAASGHTSTEGGHARAEARGCDGRDRDWSVHRRGAAPTLRRPAPLSAGLHSRLRADDATYDWTGIYVGGHVGAANARSEWTYDGTRPFHLVPKPRAQRHRVRRRRTSSACRSNGAAIVHRGGGWLHLDGPSNRRDLPIQRQRNPLRAACENLLLVTGKFGAHGTTSWPTSRAAGPRAMSNTARA